MKKIMEILRKIGEYLDNGADPATSLESMENF